MSDETGTGASAGAATDVPAQGSTGDPIAPDAAAPDAAVADAMAAPAETLGLFAQVMDFLEKGGPAIWAIAALSVITLALILWKFWRLTYIGVWRKKRAEAAVDLWLHRRDEDALATAASGRGLRARLATTAMACSLETWPEGSAREETVRVAKGLLAETRSGLRALELIATIAPLLGLFGTVLGMIAAFQTLQASGARADPSALAGGIWEALLTTAAGMAVAIPASAALTWFESVADRVRLDLEDIATRIFARPNYQSLAHAAE
ncbi:MAG: MotA/TolQ/ExbB proton channel family protein [Pseudomonadota bacterium]